MREITGEQIGSALRQLAEDVVTERRHVARLERENRELRDELEKLQRSLGAGKVRAAASADVAIALPPSQPQQAWRPPTSTRRSVKEATTGIEPV